MQECIFRNVKHCYVQAKLGVKDVKDYEMQACMACLLSRIEKQLFTMNNPKKETDAPNG